MQDYKVQEKFREACAIGDLALVCELIPKVDINSKNKMNGMTALHWAFKRGHQHIIDLLLQNGAKHLENKDGILPNQQSAVTRYPSYLQQSLGVDSNGNKFVLDIPVSESITDLKTDLESTTTQKTISNSIQTQKQAELTFRELLVFKVLDGQEFEIVGCIYFNQLTINEIILQAQQELGITVRKLYKKGKILVPINENQYEQSGDMFFNGYDLAFS